MYNKNLFDILYNIIVIILESYIKLYFEDFNLCSNLLYILKLFTVDVCKNKSQNYFMKSMKTTVLKKNYEYFFKFFYFVLLPNITCIFCSRSRVAYFDFIKG
jgi:hypothetical protein